MTGKREFDIAIWGATSYTAKLAIKYIFDTYGPSGKNIKYVLAARSLDKLRDVISNLGLPDDTPVRECTNSVERLSGLCRSATTLITFVGPYGKMGVPSVEACIKEATNYVDISGELSWLNIITSKYSEAAREAGILMLPCMGFDYVPMEMAVAALYALNKKQNNSTDHKCAITFTSNTPSISSGTIRSVVESLANPSQEVLPDYLNKAKSDFRTYENACGRFVMFHMMTVGVNCYMAWVNKILLRGQYDSKTGESFRPISGQPIDGIADGTKKSFKLVMGALFVFFMLVIPSSWRDYFLPAIGEGPKAVEAGFLSCTAANSKKLEVEFRYDLGEAYEFTGMSCVEAALGINEISSNNISSSADETTILGKAQLSGVTTGSIGLGSVYETRLKKAGVTISPNF